MGDIKCFKILFDRGADPRFRAPNTPWEYTLRKAYHAAHMELLLNPSIILCIFVLKNHVKKKITSSSFPSDYILSASKASIDDIRIWPMHGVPWRH
jgi:hypothetical protein